MIAALFVETDGCYFGLPNVDPWDISRDARQYAGSHAAVAHPPCQRWGRMAKQIEARGGKKLGDDDGCFESALLSVERVGGVLEHPAYSYAFQNFGLDPSTRFSGWKKSRRGHVCLVEQGHYGHLAPKPTYLYAVGCALPALKIGYSPARGLCEDLNKGHDRIATPLGFRDILIEMAESV